MSLRSILKGIGCVRSSFNFIRVIWVIPIQVRQVYRFSSFSAASLAVHLAKAANRHLGLANANSYTNYYPLRCGRTGYLPLRQVKISLTRNPRTKPYKVPQKYGAWQEPCVIPHHTPDFNLRNLLYLIQILHCVPACAPQITMHWPYWTKNGCAEGRTQKNHGKVFKILTDLVL